MKAMKCIIMALAILLLSGCQDFLNERPQLSLVIPSTLEDLQAILDDYDNLVRDPTVGEISSDDYYLTDADWSSMANEGHRRTYTWEKDYLFGTGTATDWLNVYRNVYAANTVLEKVDEISISESEKMQSDNIRGQAHFLRARSFLSIAAIWAPAYDPNAASEMGIPLRMESDFNIPSTRSTLSEAYDAILTDLDHAIELLPAQPLHVSRASRAAAWALKARTYLFMREYDLCLKASEECLKIKNDLMDYNVLAAAATYPIPQFNKEVIYVSHIATPQPINPSRARIDSALYDAYDTNDLRKEVFFQKNSDGSVSFKGSYQGNITMFSGLATDEVYLMRAECHARAGNREQASDDLNLLLASRWNRNNSYAPITTEDLDELLAQILMERRKQLLMRGIRWPDVKRLNIEGRNIVMKRNLNENEIILLPNDLRYALPLPEEIIELSGMPQNPR